MWARIRRELGGCWCRVGGLPCCHSARRGSPLSLCSPERIQVSAGPRVGDSILVVTEQNRDEIRRDNSWKGSAHGHDGPRA